MVIDSSALVAIILEEPDASLYYAAIANSPVRLLSAAILVESSLVLLRRRTASATAALDSLIAHLRIEIISVDHRQALLAREAFQRFGKGRHKAGLNFGDCFSYALAKQTGEPLLFKGADFSKTDVTPA
ncbi:MAG TPA: type II toxin-antitoxin system VapC family toxin [Edaphobacter sp.]